MVKNKLSPQTKSFQRLRHPDTLIFILGGVTGALINFGLTWVLLEKMGLNPLVSFFFGTVANQLFHHLYYNVVYVNQEIRLKTPLPLHLFFYLCVAGGSSMLFSFLISEFSLPLIAAIGLSIMILSLANVFLIRISTFGSAQLAEVEYREMNDSYYDDQTDEEKVSRFRAWYHRSRYERLTNFVGEYFRKGMKMADLGCANCWWNNHGLPVVGVDINEQMLKWAKRNNRLKDYKVTANLARTGLKTKDFDLVLMSETLEHVLDLQGVLSEVKRVLKDKGTFLITVPYDYFLGPFFILFNLNCIYMGYIRGSVYHKYRCGHINHFTKSRLCQVLAENGFSLKKCFVVNGLLLYAVAEKV